MSWSDLLPLVPGQLPEEPAARRQPLPQCSSSGVDSPSHPVRPIDEVQVTHILQRALVGAPLTTRHAHQSIIRPFGLVDDAVTFAKHRRDARPQRGTVRVVLDPLPIRRAWVEALLHVVLGQLLKCPRLEAEPVQHFVELGDVEYPDPSEEVIRKRATSVRRRDGRQG